MGLVVAPAARADWSPSGPGEPVTVTADPLPTVQINGVVWSQVVVGNKVFAGGNFTSARPAGSEPGANEVPRANLLAYDIRTGELDTSFAPVLNGQVLAVTKSPDEKRIYVGGQFTTVNGQTRTRVAAFDAATGALVPFSATAGTTVRALAASNDTLYIGGDFLGMGSASRAYIGAVDAVTGALLPWNPGANAQVSALTLNPDRSLLVAGGKFTTLAGIPAYGMGAVTIAGRSAPWPINQAVRNAGEGTGITSLSADNDSVYGTGFVFGPGGIFEGTFRATGKGEVTWLSTCYGDHYSVWAQGDVVYDASHSHNCGTVPDGFSQSVPASYYATGALSKEVKGTNSFNPLYRPTTWSFQGRPAPALLHWYPVWSVGSFTGQFQSAWNVTGNSDYVVFGGEFLKINGRSQQGLVRFAKPGLVATKTAAPQGTPGLQPSAVSVTPGTVDVGWQATFDRDNRDITYRVYRNFASWSDAPIYTTTVKSVPWNRPTISFRDTSPGVNPRYRVYAFDPSGLNVSVGEATVAVARSANPYGETVLASSPEHWWRMDDPTGTTLRDSRGSASADVPPNSVAAGLQMAGGAPGVGPATGTAMTLNGNPSTFAATQDSQTAPQVFSVEAWVKTTSTTGGRIVGFSESSDGSTKVRVADRHLYMGAYGAIRFGVEPVKGDKRVVASRTGFNRGVWHHVVGTLGPDGMKLYINGKLVASRTDTTSASMMQGHWRVGGDSLEGWPYRPPRDSYAGSIDEVAVYDRVLSATEVADHYAAAFRAVPPPPNAAPTSSFTWGATGLAASFDGTASTDPDGNVASYAWDFGDGTTGSGAKASRTYASPGTYTVRLTVTDNLGATASSVQSVAVTSAGSAFASDRFGRDSASGWGSAEVGGAWTTPAGSADYFVAGGIGSMRVARPGGSTAAYLNGVSRIDQDVSFSFAMDKLATGGGSFVNAVVRGGSTNSYRGKLWIRPTGTVQAQLVGVVGGGSTVLGQAEVPGLVVAPGDRLRVRVQAAGASPTTTRLKVWRDGTPEPADWLVSATDATPQLQVPGGLGVMNYVSGLATNAPITLTFDDVQGVTP